MNNTVYCDSAGNFAQIQGTNESIFPVFPSNPFFFFSYRLESIEMSSVQLSMSGEAGHRPRLSPLFAGGHFTKMPRLSAKRQLNVALRIRGGCARPCVLYQRLQRSHL